MGSNLSGGVVRVGDEFTESIDIDVRSDYAAVGLHIDGQSDADDGETGIVLNAGDINISASTHAIQNAYGVAEVGSDSTVGLTLDAGTNAVEVKGVGAETTLVGKQIDIHAGQRAISSTNAVVTVGSNDTESINLTADRNYAVFSENSLQL